MALTIIIINNNVCIWMHWLKLGSDWAQYTLTKNVCGTVYKV